MGERIRHMLEMASSDAIRLMKLNITEAKSIRMMDEIGDVMWETLHATELQDDPDIFFEAGSLYRDEVQDRDERALQMFSDGLMSADEVRDVISFHTGDSALKQAADMAHAKEIISAVTTPGLLESGRLNIEIFATDNLKAMKRVFEDFLRDYDAFSVLPEFTQDYLRDMYIAIAVGGNPEAFQAGTEGVRVWPPRPVPLPMPGLPGMPMPPGPAAAGPEPGPMEPAGPEGLLGPEALQQRDMMSVAPGLSNEDMVPGAAPERGGLA